VLEEDKARKIKKTKAEIEQFIAQSRLVVRERITVKEISPYQNLIDKEDAHLIAGAHLTKSAYLVSLDKRHVLLEQVRRQFLPLKIVSPKELLEEITL
jgi:predicted nucleic acid-binding protein